jgi:hypothetical protein
LQSIFAERCLHPVTTTHNPSAGRRLTVMSDGLASSPGPSPNLAAKDLEAQVRLLVFAICYLLSALCSLLYVCCLCSPGFICGLQSALYCLASILDPSPNLAPISPVFPSFLCFSVHAVYCLLSIVCFLLSDLGYASCSLLSIVPPRTSVRRRSWLRKSS